MILKNNFQNYKQGIQLYLFPTDFNHRIYFIGIVILAIVLRILYLQEPIRFDEAANALYYANRTIFHAIASSGGNENHALNSLFMWFSVRLFGWNEWAVRLPVFCVGILSVWSSFSFVKWISKDEKAGLFASSIIATSPWMVFYSVNGRGYMYQVFLLMILIPLVIKSSQNLPKKNLINLGIAAGFISVLGAFAVRSMMVYVFGIGIAAILMLVFYALKQNLVYIKKQLFFVASWIFSSLVFVAIFFFIPIYRNGKSGLLGVAHGYSTENANNAVNSLIKITFQSLSEVVPRFADQLEKFPFYVLYGLLLLGLILKIKKSNFLWLFLALCGTIFASFFLTLFVKQGFYSRIFIPIVVFIVPFIAITLSHIVRAKRWAILPILGILITYTIRWNTQEIINLRNETGDLPEAKPVALQIIAQKHVKQHIFLAPPIWDVCIAFYLKSAGHTTENMCGLGLNSSFNRDAQKHCAYDTLAVLTQQYPNSKDWGKFKDASWYNRINTRLTSIQKINELYYTKIPLQQCEL